MRSYAVLSLGLTLSTVLFACATGGDPFSTGGGNTGGEAPGGSGNGGDPSNGGSGNVTDDTTTKTSTTNNTTNTSTSTNTSTGTMGCSGFQCANGQCINATQECDNTVHCADGSDEAPYNAACPGTTSTGTGGGACDPFFEFTCGSGECLPIFFICDGGLLDCGDGSDEDPALCGSGGTTAPPEWTCDPTYYDAADGCDCGCGAIDLDCPSSNVDACEYCDDSGSCSASACPGDIDPTNNAICAP